LLSLFSRVVRFAVLVVEEGILAFLRTIRWFWDRLRIV
jgi:hypothetical protein